MTGNVATEVLAYPYYPSNPWQDIMYRQLSDQNIALQQLSSLNELTSYPSASTRSVLHLNWLTPIVQVHPTVADAVRAVRRAIQELEQFAFRGGRILWSVHNLISHERGHLLPEISLASGLARLADRVVIMNPDTVSLARELFEIPEEKVVQIPHPSYLGEYPQRFSREESRRALGVPDDAIAVLFFGVIRPYKGLEKALELVNSTSSGRRLHLLVAGEAGGAYDGAALQERLDVSPRVTARIGFIDPAEVHVWYRASDVVYSPFSTALNSGSLHLAASFGVPVVTPLVDATASISTGSWVTTYRPRDSVAVVRSLIERAASMRSPDVGGNSEAIQFADSRSPSLIAARFAQLVREVAS